ncbi:transcriptional regulator [Knoellia sinensis KCTC 19936]|uniref:Transcriptional regulator n=1 Tax=Knoellia sinensis KCTC 19936 TaxID=1385520 RepID=A0A0A0J361_9MICO|nr:MerR family transcriptional regulator [Knoellia sinensis]KGN30066.1 transcriptional regulator [Knoellia sinensis KCTC 19936]
MRLAELSDASGVSVATLKYYLREGLLHPGAVVSRTQADYDDTHVERVRLVRALSEVGGLPLATIARVLEVITTPGKEWLEVLEAAQRTLLKPVSDKGFGGAEGRGRARAWVAKRGWFVDPEDPFLDELDRAWAASDAGGIGFDEERLNRYADHVEGIAEVDIDTVPTEPEAAIRQVIIGTILVDPVLAALRRLAQQHVSNSVAGHH